ncbi:hypothetical protein C8Q74DRAFT_348706 [Fomes fomentarius]|nr:hypothetical protein C8Q74DRAFT_348706 [Fomes fomentarius]
MQHVYEYSSHFSRWLLGSLIGDMPPLTEEDTPSCHAVEHMAYRSRASSISKLNSSPSPGASTPTIVPSAPQVGSADDHALEDTAFPSLDLLTHHDDPTLQHTEVIEQQSEREPPPAVGGGDMSQDGTDGTATPDSATIQQLSEPVSKDHTSDDSHPDTGQTLTDSTTLPGPCVDQNSPRRDEELWFEDGSLILVARDIEFRVYKGPLVAQSGFFKDMLSLPQPGDSSSTPSNDSSSPSCATIHLSDSPEDLRHFLRVFVEGTLRFEPTFNEISAYIRLGHKYQCEKLTQQCLAYLRKYYTDDYDLWFQVHWLDPPSFLAIHRIGILNLARLTGADYLLPGVLMCCCMLGPEISQGFEREDGTWETLSIEDLTLCFIARARLLEATFVAAHRVFRPTVADGCTNPERCTSALQYLLSEMVANESVMQDVRELRFDYSKSGYANETEQGRALCSKCYPLVVSSGRPAEEHRAIFKRLPEIMGVTVEGWWTGERQGDPSDAASDAN